MSGTTNQTAAVVAMATSSGYRHLSEEECLSDRKWWCFLVSSIFTFMAGILSVLLYRLVVFLCCRAGQRPEYTQSSAKEAKPLPPPGAQPPKPQFEGNFVSEAKDWAGELMSGQTTTGRIMVSGRTV